MAGKVDLSGLKLLRSMPTALEAAVLGACREYANRGYRGEPIVRRHFTAGNRSRYEWAPLSPRYAAWKDGVTKQKKEDMAKAKRVVPKGKGLPMLVLSGAMRDAITSGRARVTRVGPGRFVIRWANDPHYTIYHHLGMGHNPKRSPVEPNAEDIQAIWAAANRYLSGFIAAGGAVPAGGAPGGKARVA